MTNSPRDGRPIRSGEIDYRASDGYHHFIYNHFYIDADATDGGGLSGINRECERERERETAGPRGQA